jgi:hypothetical protein
VRVSKSERAKEQKREGREKEELITPEVPSLKRAVLVVRCH